MSEVAQIHGLAYRPWGHDQRIRVITLFAGMILLAAAALKAFSPAESAMFEVAYELPRWTVLALVQVELLLAAALLCGLRQRFVWQIAIATFSIFAAFLLYRGLAGYETCGCFGVVKVSPWWTFIMDIAIIAGLVTHRRHWTTTARGNEVRRAVILGPVYLAIGIPSFLLMQSAAPADVHGESFMEDGSTFVVLEPTEWVGQSFPLNRFIDADGELASGEWILLMYHHDCPECQKALPQFEKLAVRLAEQASQTQVLLVEVPPHGHESIAHAAVARYAKLSDQRDWFVQAPVEIRLSEGKVTDASTDLPSISHL